MLDASDVLKAEFARKVGHPHPSAEGDGLKRGDKIDIEGGVLK